MSEGLASALVVQFLVEIEVLVVVGHAPPPAVSISVATGLIGKVEVPHFTPTRDTHPRR